MTSDSHFSPGPHRIASASRVGWLVVATILTSAILSAPAARTTTYHNTISDSLPVYHLGEVIEVEGHRDLPPVSLGVLGSIQMNRQGLETTREALNTLPGVYATYGQKGEAHLQIRGFQGREVMILLDGRPVNLPYYGDVDLHSLPLGAISKVNVVKGATGPLYGANTLGGIVNLITKRTVGYQVRQLQLSSGTGSSYAADLNYGAGTGSTDYWLSAGYSQSDGYRLSDDFEPSPFEDGGERNNTDYETWHVDGKLSHVLSGGSVLSFSSGYYDAKRGLPSSNEFAVYQRFVDWRRHYYDLSGEGNISTPLSWRGKLYLTKSYNRLKRYQDADYDDSRLRFDSVHDMDDLGFRGTLGWTATADILVTGGVSLSRNTIDLQPDANQAWEHYWITSRSVFAQATVTPTDRLTLAAGAAINNMISNNDDASETNADPHVSASFQAEARLKLRGAVSSASRFPTLEHLYSFDSGNPDLKPEKAVKVEFGYDLSPNEQVTLSQTWFHSDVDDLIDRVSRMDLYMNLDAVVLRGLETEIEYEPRAWLHLSLGHTYLDAFDDNTGDRRVHSPRNKTDYNVAVSYRNLTVSHSGQYVSDRVAPSQQTMPDYYLAHARVGYTVGLLEIFVNARNLLDKSFEEEKGWPTPGRMITAGIKASY